MTNAQNEIVAVLGTFITRASGASYHNGFGLKINGISPDKVISATGYYANSASIITYAPNGIEAN